MRAEIDGFAVEHLHGPEEISYTDTELIVVCLVRDGLPWVGSFIEHYFSLGVKHIVFLDNESTDGTVDACSRYDGVTVLRTRAPFRGNQGSMRRYLIDRFGKDRWSLCVDIDELFDYPYSDVVALDSLLGYLNSKSYTAVTARMLDMFPEKLSSNRTHELVEAWKEEHRFYDISGLRRSRMSKDNDVIRNNVFESDEVAVAFTGGIRDSVFGSPAPRKGTKYPLIFSDGTLKHVGPHKVYDARVADFTCVLFHYKFYAFSLQEYWRKVIEHRKNAKSSTGRLVYKQYLEVLEENPDLQLKRETSREISSVNDLLENWFLVASEDYVSWVGAEEEGSLSLAPPSSEPHVLAEAFLESRRQERAKTLRMGRLEQRLLEHGSKVQVLEQQLGDRGQKIQDLEQQLGGRDEELQRSNYRQQRMKRRQQRMKYRQQRLVKRVGVFRQQLENVQASRVWKLAEMLRHIKAKLKGLRRSSR